MDRGVQLDMCTALAGRVRDRTVICDWEPQKSSLQASGATCPPWGLSRSPRTYSLVSKASENAEEGQREIVMRAACSGAKKYTTSCKAVVCNQLL